MITLQRFLIFNNFGDGSVLTYISTTSLVEGKRKDTDSRRGSDGADCTSWNGLGGVRQVTWSVGSCHYTYVQTTVVAVTQFAFDNW